MKIDSLKYYFYLLTSISLISLNNYANELNTSLLSPFSSFKKPTTILYDFDNFGIFDIFKIDAHLNQKAVFKILNSLGFKYSNKINSGFKIPIYTNMGKLENIIVSGDGEHAFVIRHRKDFSKTNLEEIEYLNILELNLLENEKYFINKDNIEKENFTGSCNYTTTQKTKSIKLLPFKKNEIEHPINNNKTLESILLSLLIEKAFSKGINNITVFTNRINSIHFYKKLGFEGKKKLSLYLDKYSNIPNLNKAFWTSNKVTIHHGISHADFRYENKNEEYVINFNIKLLIKRLFNNNLIKRFYKFEKPIPLLRKKPLTILAFDFLNINNIHLTNIILKTEMRGNTFIMNRAKEILNEFSSKYKNESKQNNASNWEELINKKTLGEYDFTQLLSHILTAASGYLEIIKYSSDDEELLNKFNENTEEIWIILRAIDMEASSLNLKSKNNTKMIKNEIVQKSA